jgi:hypothetical protein
MPAHASPHGHTPSTDVLAAQLAASESATLYTEIPGLDEAGAEAMLLADPPLHVEFDQVRGVWSVRAATPEEVEDAQLAATAPAPVTATAHEDRSSA